VALYSAISRHQTVNIRQISQNRAEQIGYYRFLENEQVNISELVRSISDHCSQQVAVHWRLMTTHEIDHLEQALQVRQWYRWRWRIEQLFATLKLAGLDIEATQLESVLLLYYLSKACHQLFATPSRLEHG
jgi:hypothetical protein